MFAVDTPASSRALLTAQELRVAVGLADSDTSQDTRLGVLGLRVSDAIARHCKVAEDGVNPPTLLSELCSETIWLDGPRDSLVLTRRFVTSVAAVAENSVVLGVGAYEVNKPAGILWRIASERRICWTGVKVVLQYSAGFAAPPSDIKQAAELYLRQLSSMTTRDPLVKRERVDNVSETEFWVGSIDASNGSALPSDVAALLTPYVTYSL